MTLRTMVRIATLIIVLGVVAYGVCFKTGTNPGPVTLKFTAQMADEPLIFDEFSYLNPGGNGTFRVRDFRVYVSNITLSDGDNTHVVKDSYHLLRFDRDTTDFSVVLPDVPLQTISDVSMSIGIDAAANGSIESRGNLDPNNRMAWNWKIGYKFVLVEGAIKIDGAIQPLVYHVGFSENRRDLSFATPASFTRNDNTPIPFLVDLMKLFTGATVVDMVALPTVKMDKSDAEKLANNYTAMITADWAAP
ncbi:MAG: MbnP family protein [Paracoccaceae bacterium]